MEKVNVCLYKHQLIYKIITRFLNQIFPEKDEKYKIRRYIMSVYLGCILPSFRYYRHYEILSNIVQTTILTYLISLIIIIEIIEE